MNRLSPFAPALFAAGLSSGWNPAAMLAGCVLSIPLGYAGPESFSACLSCLCVYGCFCVVRMAFLPDSRTVWGRDIAMAACAGIGALLPGLALAKGLAYNLFAAFASCVIASACAPSLYAAVSVRPGRERLLPDERLSLALLAGICILGGNALPGSLRYVPLAEALLCVLLVSGGGAAKGCLAGAFSGVALRLCGFEAQFCALLSLCGAFSGAASALNRPASSMATVLSVAIISGWSLGAERILAPCVCAAVAGVVYCLLPDSLVSLAAGDSLSEREIGDKRAAQRLRGDLAKRVSALADVFGELSAGYSGEGSALPDERAMTSRLREKLCGECPAYAACWSDGGGTASRLLCQLLGMAFSGAVPGEDAQLPPEVGRICRRASQIPRRLGPMLAEYDARRRAELKRDRLKALMAVQFAQARDALLRASEDIRGRAECDPALSEAARSALESEGVRVESLYALGGSSPEICARLAERPADGAALKRVAKRLGEETGYRFIASASDGRRATLSLAPRCVLKAGSKSVSGVPDGKNGDSRAAMRLYDGRALLALSDGMGSGERAAKESAETLRLIVRFLQAGIEPGAALDAINELMLLRSGEDMYATVDLCVIDPVAGGADLIKLGACRTYLLRGGACVRLEGGRLPLGILEEIRPVRRSVPLRAGDMLVMATDGLEGDEGDEWIVRSLYALCDDTPQRVCDELVREAVARRVPGGHHDDATVIAVRVGAA